MEIHVRIFNYLTKNVSFKELLFIIILSCISFLGILQTDIITNIYKLFVIIILIITSTTLFVKLIQPIIKFINDYISSVRLYNIEDLSPDEQKILVFFYQDNKGWMAKGQPPAICLNKEDYAIKSLERKGFIENVQSIFGVYPRDYPYHDDYKLTCVAKHKLNSSKFKNFCEKFMACEQNYQEMLNFINTICHPNRSYVRR